MRLIHQRVLRNQVVMRDRSGLGQACRATAVQPCRRRGLGDLFIVEADPVRLAMLEQVFPG